MFYKATVDHFFTFGMACWGGNASIQDKNRHNKSIMKAGGVVPTTSRCSCCLLLSRATKQYRHSLSSSSDKITEDNFG